MLPLKLRILLLTAIFLSNFASMFASDSLIPKKDFGIEEGQLPEDIATFPELKTWAIYQSYELEPDAPHIGLQDYICRMVPETGFQFLLEKQVVSKSTVFLYLDLTRYRTLKGSKFKPRKLNILVNGRPKISVYVDKNQSFTNPVEIPLEPSEYPNGKIYVDLVPSHNSLGRFWGIWDAFVLENRLEARD
ncbi:hypothetical protein ND861_00755 [Leptospira sp. 2 VSF19]|uniref:Uncharacterized protein n=1 Tax=Leptospira soteropolitanensis TaxID=2950025 RepID=A0AAW5VF79_9LEPT|nr:hypothetical protein [Leptospira soteropolitanensis]MCW7491172.1 hypothetical protein [Leptospira soteropolitanensis]MCW7498756.1 hypothetical protein [Leptospira soteropolitanensis]MCW7521651.1 hypothetical protein [Leptospira soteropolitanensis]MCW7524860.1 hypothetical protein [Leptospira soteropolitanensis]MCW7528727.1 hypothetical protein [Leptospira soteropolitanensis]